MEFYLPDLLVCFLCNSFFSFLMQRKCCHPLTKNELVDQVKRMRALKAALVASPTTLGGVRIQSDMDERTLSGANFKRKRFEGLIPS